MRGLDKYWALLVNYSNLVYKMNKLETYYKREVEMLHNQNIELRRQLKNDQAAAHKKNLDLDAMHYVWCTGSCQGVHRYCESEDITPEQLTNVMNNTYRILAKFIQKVTFTDEQRSLFQNRLRLLNRILAYVVTLGPKPDSLNHGLHKMEEE